MNDIFTNIIFILLGIDTIRVIINALGFYKEEWPFSWIIYGKKRPSTIEEALIKLGYSKQITRNITDIISPAKVFRHLDKKDDEWCYSNLIKLINRCMVKYDRAVNYGNSMTEYYIDTMSGFHKSDENKHIMHELMIYLLKKHKKFSPSFIITPKNGNPLFGWNIASSLNIPILLHKHKNESSRVSPREAESEVCTAPSLFNVNFEGASLLDVNKKSEGILLDCNISGGSQIIWAGEEFKKLITLQGVNNKRCPTIKYAFALFRVDDDSKADKQFIDAGIEIKCILKLSEDVKHKIFDLKENPSDADISVIIEELKKVGYLLLPPQSTNMQSTIKNGTTYGENNGI